MSTAPVGERNALIEAAKRGDLAATRERLDDSGPTPAVNKADGLGRTALHYAARLGHEDIVAALLAAGADVGARDAAGFTPLMRAVQGGDANAPVVERLLAAGADPGDAGPEADAITLATTLGAERLRLILESAAN